MTIGSRVPMVDATERVTGALDYVLDLRLPGMAEAALLRSPHAHARIVRARRLGRGRPAGRRRGPDRGRPRRARRHRPDVRAVHPRPAAGRARRRPLRRRAGRRGGRPGRGDGGRGARADRGRRTSPCRRSSTSRRRSLPMPRSSTPGRGILASAPARHRRPPAGLRGHERHPPVHPAQGRPRGRLRGGRGRHRAHVRLAGRRPRAVRAPRRGRPVERRAADDLGLDPGTELGRDGAGEHVPPADDGGPGHRAHARRRLRRQDRPLDRADRRPPRPAGSPAGPPRARPERGVPDPHQARRPDPDPDRRPARRDARRPRGDLLVRRRRVRQGDPREDLPGLRLAWARTASRTSTSTRTACTPTRAVGRRSGASASRRSPGPTSPQMDVIADELGIDPLELRLPERPAAGRHVLAPASGSRRTSTTRSCSGPRPSGSAGATGRPVVREGTIGPGQGPRGDHQGHVGLPVVERRQAQRRRQPPRPDEQRSRWARAPSPSLAQIAAHEATLPVDARDASRTPDTAVTPWDQMSAASRTHELDGPGHPGRGRRRQGPADRAMAAQRLEIAPADLEIADGGVRGQGQRPTRRSRSPALIAGIAGRQHPGPGQLPRGAAPRHGDRPGGRLAAVAPVRLRRRGRGRRRRPAGSRIAAAPPRRSTSGG